MGYWTDGYMPKFLDFRGTLWEVDNLYLDREFERYGFSDIISINDVINNLINFCTDHGYSYAYALHDSDFFDDTGELKKAHYHFYIKTTGAIFRHNLAFSFYYDMGIQPNEVRKPENLPNFNKCIRYLIHADSSDKFKYHVSIIKSNLSELQLSEICQNTMEDEERCVQLIISAITSGTCTNYRELLDFALANHIYASYRRGYSLIKDIAKGYGF